MRQRVAVSVTNVVIILSPEAVFIFEILIVSQNRADSLRALEKN